MTFFSIEVGKWLFLVLRWVNDVLESGWVNDVFSKKKNIIFSLGWVIDVFREEVCKWRFRKEVGKLRF